MTYMSPRLSIDIPCGFSIPPTPVLTARVEIEILWTASPPLALTYKSSPFTASDVERKSQSQIGVATL